MGAIPINKSERRRVWWKGTYARFRWTVKRFGWRHISIVTPVVWRWSLYTSLRLFPSGPWFFGVAFGRDETDNDPFLRIDLLVLELYVLAAECMSYDEYDRLYAAEGEQ